ncbi:hypothetical protein M9458_052944 [Cirrhinus mrigala]|uniref:CCHC-type domain-containing protein n=1 Tax=Cirrhinus mrigala TaxID=683832 RepID=A0ABD0MNY5_CIRMR
MDGLTGNNLGLVGEGRMAKSTGLKQERNEANDDGLERETSIVNNAGTERERSGINEAGPKNGQRERNNQFTSKRKYLRRRQLYPGTNIEDGTRFVKVRFPREIVSLPYSTKLETAEGPQFFRVMHSNQVKTCKLCMSPDHLVKDCPDFRCYKCEERGHFARDCDAVRCPECRNFLNKCECWMEEEEGGGDIQVGGQVHEGSNEEEQSATPAQAQQIPAEEDENGAEARNEVAENERDNQTVQTVDLTWTPMEITPSFKDLLEAVEKDEQKEQIDSGREEKEEQTEKDKIVRRQTRRSSKVTPKLDIPKKVIKKGQIKHRSRYEVLRGLEEEKED